jgi:hypothetical protein
MRMNNISLKTFWLGLVRIMMEMQLWMLAITKEKNCCDCSINIHNSYFFFEDLRPSEQLVVALVKLSFFLQNR